MTGSDASGSTQVATRTLSRSSLSRGPLSGSNYPPSSRETRPSQVPIVRGGQSDGSDRSPSSRDTRPGRATTGRGRPLRRRGAVNNDGFDEDGDRTYRRKKDDEGITFSKEEKMALMKTLGHVEPFQIKPAQGPYLDMTSMMMEFAPKHFGATEPVSGQYPLLTDNNRRGLLQDIVRQVRKNETYTEKNIDQMAKKLGPAMPRA